MSPSGSRSSMRRKLKPPYSPSAWSSDPPRASFTSKIHRRQRSKPRIAQIPTRSIPTFVVHVQDQPLPPLPNHTLSDDSLSPHGNDEEDGDASSRLDSMTVRLRELIIEGQRALCAESPMVAGEGWIDTTPMPTPTRAADMDGVPLFRLE